MSDLKQTPGSFPPLGRIGILSDTHGLFRPELGAAFEDVDLIIHAGDVGKKEVLDALKRIAPVVAVRGNVDRGTWADELSKTEIVDADNALIYVIHDVNELDLDPRVGFKSVISGHSHRPKIVTREGVLYINPGSAGPKRFSLPVSAAHLLVRGTVLEATLIYLRD
jgi:uncharacterized protein